MNSVEVDGNYCVISLRHTDGVYKIDRDDRRHDLEARRARRRPRA